MTVGTDPPVPDHGGGLLAADGAQGWVLLYDAAWVPSRADGDAPAELVAGGWPLFADGGVGAFHVNDLHRAEDAEDDAERDRRAASESGSGTIGATDELDPSLDPDPVGTALELMLLGRAPVELVQLVLRDCLVHVAMNGDGRPLIVRSADDRLCLLVATCWDRREESDPPDWRETDVDGLAELAGSEWDALFNPVGPAPARLAGPLIRETAGLSAEDASALFAPVFADLRGGEDADPAPPERWSAP